MRTYAESAAAGRQRYKERNARVQAELANNPTLPCDVRLAGYQRLTSGAPLPIRCTRRKGHAGGHSDQTDGVPIDWNAVSVSCEQPDHFRFAVEGV